SRRSSLRRPCTSYVVCTPAVGRASGAHLAPHSFPTRRSSDLTRLVVTPGQRRGPDSGDEATRLPRRERGRARDRTVAGRVGGDRSEEHTSELQSRFDLVCRLLLEKTNRATAGAPRAAP